MACRFRPQKPFRACLVAIVLFMAGWMISVDLVAIVQCTPIER
jgi:hypothetical protein